MKMYLLMGGGLVLVIAVCVGVIHFEAAETRDAMREMARDEIPKGVRDGIQGAIGNTGDQAASVDNVLGKIQSTIEGVAGTATGGKSMPSIPQAAETAGKVAGGLLDQARDTIAGPADSSSGDSGNGDSGNGGGLLGKVQSTVGDVLGTGRKPEKPKAADDSAADDSTGDDSAKADSEKPRSKKSSSKKSSSRTADSQDDDSGRSTGKSDSDSKTKSDGEGDEAEKNPRSASDTVGGLFDTLRGVTKAGDQIGQQLLGLSDEEEREWGQRLNEQIISQEKIVHNRALAKRIDRIAAPLLSARKRRQIDYTFTVIQSEDDDINAFSIVGGYIYLHTALIDFVKNDQELQFVVAHEIGHVDLGHCTRQLTYTARASQLATPVAGQIAGILHSLITRPYTKDQEFDADAYGFKAVIAAGQTRQQALAFPRRFGQWLKDHQLEDERVFKDDQTVAGTLASRVEDHFHTHPPMDERIARLEAIQVSSRANK